MQLIILIRDDVESENVLEVLYMLKKAHWHKGYAIEGGKACLTYAWNEIDVDKVYATIRPENQSSRKVVEKLGFSICGEYAKHYNGKDMLHLIYVIER